jgi:uncharacterized membrane protein YesL
MIPDIEASATTADAHGARHRWRGRDLAFFALSFLFLFIAAAGLRTATMDVLTGPMAEVLAALALTLIVEVALLSATFFLVEYVYGLSYREEMRISLAYRVSHRSLIVLAGGLAAAVVLVSAVVSTLIPSLLASRRRSSNC